MLNAVRANLTNLSTSSDQEAGKDEDNNQEDTVLLKLTEDDKPG